MRSALLDKLSGYVQIEVAGNPVEPLINKLLAAHLSIWNILRMPSGHVRMNIRLRHYFRLRPLVRKSGCKVRVIARSGLPFVLSRLGRRKMFVAGFVCFILGLYLLSSLVWHVDVEGNEVLTDSEVLQAANLVGIHPFQWKFQLDDERELSKALVSQLPGTAWVGVSIQGTQITIQIVESVKPKEKALQNPRNLVAAHDAVITSIQATRGMPAVKTNMRVKKGDVLISGLMGDAAHSQVVAAEGSVKGLVWYEYKIEVPLWQKKKTFTGNQRTRGYFVIGGRALHVTGFGKSEYEKSESEPHLHRYRLGPWTLPFGWLDETIREVRFEQTRVTEEQARNIGLARAQADILLHAGPDAEIKEQNVLHEHAESGKVYINAHYEVDQEITKEQVLVQGE